MKSEYEQLRTERRQVRRRRQLAQRGAIFAIDPRKAMAWITFGCAVGFTFCIIFWLIGLGMSVGGPH